ncbi:nucleoside permease [Bacillus pseudomycoides]|uniref:nucleoside permease n=1 Tax=Bacillus pseudomycoides TaxID=64104 RepID=UPI000BF52B53|nr:nucleoside permease [Bacillus pseudomycoides]PFZ08416.1 nucleoside permease [Bacillus pseudomycoides]PFZ09778.1 nucleoside permease [Bacillus pseudomycoides]
MTLNRWLTDEEIARASENGINRRTLMQRVYESNWDLEEALTAPIGSVNHGYERKYSKWLKIASKNGINQGTFFSRVSAGWESEEAANKPVNKMSDVMKEMLKVAKSNGISYQTFYSRVMKYKWDMEAAATTPPNNTRKRYVN